MATRVRAAVVQLLSLSPHDAHQDGREILGDVPNTSVCNQQQNKQKLL